MSTVTPNFNWPVPTSTDLVKDGATAIEALGDSIDASLVDLKGGTTGQVLSKTSNTDMDFTWVAADDTNAIQNTIVDAKGDLIAASAADTPARLAVGANGETLVADSSTATGLRYTAGNPIPNPVINSAFQIWQRGTSVTVTSSAYTADRWMGYRGVAGATISRQVTGDTTNLPNIQYCARVQRNSGNTATDYIAIVNSFETINSIPYAGKTVTLSFYARAGANYSAASSAMQVILATGTGTDQNVLLSYTGSSNIVSTAATLTTTWQRFTYTASVSSTATEMGMYFYYSPVGTAGANDFFEITGVQIDIGSVALPFRTNGATIQGELAACQRYYYRAGGGQDYVYLGFGVGASATSLNLLYQFPVTMRTAPTAVDFSTIGWYLGGGVTSISAVAINTGYQGRNAAFLTCTTTGLSGIPVASVLVNQNTSGYLGVSAEL